MKTSRLFLLAALPAALFFICGNAKGIEVVETEAAKANSAGDTLPAAAHEASGHGQTKAGRKHRKPKPQDTHPGGLHGMFLSLLHAGSNFGTKVKSGASSLWKGSATKKTPTAKSKHGRRTSKSAALPAKPTRPAKKASSSTAKKSTKSSRTTEG